MGAGSSAGPVDGDGCLGSDGGVGDSGASVIVKRLEANASCQMTPRQKTRTLFRGR